MAAFSYAAQLGANTSFQAPPIPAYNLGTGDFTVEAWVRTSTAGATGTIIARKGSAGGRNDGGLLLVLQPRGALKLATDNGSGYYQVVTGATSAGDGTWHHVAGVRRGAALSVYLDGVAVPGTASGNATPPLDISNSDALTIGTTAQTQEPYRQFAGQLNAVTLWNAARSAAQIATDMRTAAPGGAALIGCWLFADRTGADTSPNHNAAAAVGAVTYVAPGAPIDGGDYAAFLGANGTFTAPASPAYQLGTRDFTVQAWVRTASPGGTGTIISRKGSAGGPGNGGFLLVLGASGTVKIATDNGSGYFQALTGPTAAGDGRWHHLAAVRQGAALQIYLDGLPVAATTSGNAAPPLDIGDSLPLSIGTTAQTSEPYRQFGGHLAEVSFWNTARDAAAVWSDMHTVLTGTEAGLIGLWPFTFRNGIDLSPTANNAVPAGSAGYVSPGAPIGWYAAVLANRAYLQAPSNAAYQLGTGDFTVEAWIRTAAPGGSGTIISRKGGAGGAGKGGFLFVLRPDGTLKLATDNGLDFYEFDSSPTTAGDGNWHFVAGVRQGAQLSVLVDGRPIPGSDRGTGTPPLNVDSSQPVTLAATLQNQEPYPFFTGRLDGVALWQGARSPAMVATDMGIRFTGREAGLLGFWGFDFRDGRDTSPTKGDAVAVGAVGYEPPGAPIGWVITEAPAITRAADDGHTLTAEWTVVQQPLVTGYHLTLYDGAGQPVDSWRGTGTQASLASPQQPGSYTIRVQATGTTVEGPWSDPLPIVTQAPANLVVTVSDTGIDAIWAAVGSAAGYRLELSAGGTAVETGDFATTSGRLPLPADRARDHVMAVRGQAGQNAVSTGPWSTPVPVMLTPPTLTRVTFDGQAVHLAWTAPTPSPRTGFLAALFANGTQVSAIRTSETTATLPLQPQPGTTYVVRVASMSGESRGAWSAPVTVITAVPTALVAGAVTTTTAGTTSTHAAARWATAGAQTAYEAALSTAGVWGEPQATASQAITFPGILAAGALYTVRARIAAGISSGPWCAAVPGPFLRTGTVVYDDIGRLLSLVLPGVATTSYVYDADGNITNVDTTRTPATGAS